MSEASATAAPQTHTWAAANRAYLDGELRGLRARLQQRVAWLRRQWQSDALHGYQQVVSDGQADRLLAGEDWAAEQRFYRDDELVAAAGRALHEAEEQAAGLAAAMTEADTPPALTVLVNLFGLNEFERRVLLLCLAPELDPAFAELYAYVQDHAGRKYVTSHLALSLYGGEGAARLLAHDSFLPAAALRRFALVELETEPLPAAAEAARPMRLAPRVADYLRGVNRLDTRIADVLRPAPAAPLAPAQQELALRLAQMLQARAPAPMTLNLLGGPGVGKQAVAEAVCSQLGLALYRLDTARLPAIGSEQRHLWRLMEREAVLAQLAYYVDASAPETADAGAAAATRDLVESLDVLLFVGSEERWPAERELVAVRVPRPAAAEQQLLWQQALTDTPHEAGDHVPAIVQQFDFGARDIVRAVEAAQSLAGLRAAGNGTVVTGPDLWQACRQQSGLRLNQLAQRIQPVYAWDDIVLPDDLAQHLRELAAQVAHRHRVYETWGFGAQMSRGRGISALFAGPSGTGKTMAAEILANALQLDLYRIDLAGVVSKYIGETEKNLRQVFDAAEQSGAILFFDEADALFGKRTEVKDSHDRYANIEVNYLLQRMEEYRGLAILATNRKSALDRAFLRRLRFLLDFPFPDVPSRRRIWEKVFPSAVPLDGLDFQALARLEISGGNIRNIALNAAFLAADEGAPVAMRQVMHAARREYGKIDKMLSPAEFGEYYKTVQI
jgi:AAA+ superfamily predicted ATPase